MYLQYPSKDFSLHESTTSISKGSCVLADEYNDAESMLGEVLISLVGNPTRKLPFDSSWNLRLAFRPCFTACERTKRLDLGSLVALGLWTETKRKGLPEIRLVIRHNWQLLKKMALTFLDTVLFASKWTTWIRHFELRHGRFTVPCSLMKAKARG